MRPVGGVVAGGSEVSKERIVKNKLNNIARYNIYYVVLMFTRSTGCIAQPHYTAALSHT
jgi:hypothetical protein